MVRLGRILIYPIKSLDGVSVNEAAILPSGAIASDRQFAIFDEQGQFVNGKRCAKIHGLHSTFDLVAKTVTLEIKGEKDTATFPLKARHEGLEDWLSQYFEQSVYLHENTVSGFPDDTQASGPTVISDATLETVASWFEGMSVPEMRSRFRTNLELEDVPPFWEDQLFGNIETTVTFEIGDVLLQGTNPCQRCVVPTRDSHTGKVTPHFQQIVSQKRQETLPSWVNSSRFNHFYRLAVNTTIPSSEAGKVLKVGDEVKIVGGLNY